MRFNSVRSSDYSQSAKAVTKNADAIFQASRDASPDFTKISQEAIKGRSLERRTATEAEGKVARAGINAFSKVKRADMKADAAKKAEDIKRPARRMAGVVGALGTLAGTAVIAKGNKADREAAAKRDAQYAANTELLRSVIDESRFTPEELPAPPTINMPDLQSLDGSSTTSSGGGSSSTSVSLAGGNVDRQEVYTYLTKTKGLSHNKAYGLMANIDRESAFKTDNPGDGGYSNGLFQWNKERLTAMQTAVPDWKTNWKGQIDYALTEPGEASGQTYLSTTWQSPSAAAEHWTRKWERPAHPDRDVLRNNEFLKLYDFK